MKGLFKISNDPNFAAADFSDDGNVLFPGTNGRPHRDLPQGGELNSLSDEALFNQSNDATLLEAANAYRQGRQPRWNDDILR